MTTGPSDFVEEDTNEEVVDPTEVNANEIVVADDDTD